MDPTEIRQRGEAVLSAHRFWPRDAPGTRRNIVDAALATFASRGFHGSTLKDISNGSGLSTAALYVHFASKEDLLFEISRHGHAVALAILEGAVAEATSAAAELDLMVYCFTRWHAEQKTLAYVVQREWMGLNTDHHEAVRALRSRIQACVRSVLTRGASTGELDVPDVRSASAAVLSLCIDIARWYEPDGPYTPDAIGQIYMDFARRLFGVDRAGPVPSGSEHFGVDQPSLPAPTVNS
ncbi:TetR/AcrR family transcriptional regulator [Nocardioides endophyticus]|uniref:TetR/AcrR family transcriptional regulator n=1 Tax=Nocardioides endophyticus TaxID=1353775 RepID=A0ABP8ZD98_9ACTN